MQQRVESDSRNHTVGPASGSTPEELQTLKQHPTHRPQRPPFPPVSWFTGAPAYSQYLLSYNHSFSCLPCLLTLLFSKQWSESLSFSILKSQKTSFTQLVFSNPPPQVICGLMEPIERAAFGSGAPPRLSQPWGTRPRGMQTIVTAHSAEAESMAGNGPQFWDTPRKFKSRSFYHVQNSKGAVWG